MVEQQPQAKSWNQQLKQILEFKGISMIEFCREADIEDRYNTFKHYMRSGNLLKKRSDQQAIIEAVGYNPFTASDIPEDIYPELYAQIASEEAAQSRTLREAGMSMLTQAGTVGDVVDNIWFNMNRLGVMLGEDLKHRTDLQDLDATANYIRATVYELTTVCQEALDQWGRKDVQKALHSQIEYKTVSYLSDMLRALVSGDERRLEEWVMFSTMNVPRRKADGEK